MNNKQKSKLDSTPVDIYFADLLSPFIDDLLEKISKLEYFQKFTLEEQMNSEANIYLEFLSYMFEYIDQLIDDEQLKNEISDLAKGYDTVEELFDLFSGLIAAKPELSELVKMSFVKKYKLMCEKLALPLNPNLISTLLK